MLYKNMYLNLHCVNIFELKLMRNFPLINMRSFHLSLIIIFVWLKTF